MAVPSECHVVPGLLLTIASYILICSGQNLNASFVFGDSLVDTGNNNYIVSLSKADYLPNGIDFLPSRQPTGRYANGRTIVDILGQELGLQKFTPPYLAPSTVGPVILNGVNYASGGGGILNATGKVYVSTLFSYSLVVIWNYLTPVLSAPQRATTPPETFIDALISNYRLQLTRLYVLDARKIVVSNVGPIGCIPYTREINPSAGTNCVAFPNQLAQRFNERLKDLVVELSSNLEGSLFVYANVYPIVSDIIQNYNSYGFEVADSACCIVSGRYGGLVPCGPTSKVCPDRSRYVFWDPYHPSDAANVIIAKRLLDGDQNDIFPMNVRQLVQASVFSG